MVTIKEIQIIFKTLRRINVLHVLALIFWVVLYVILLIIEILTHLTYALYLHKRTCAHGAQNFHNSGYYAPYVNKIFEA